MTGRRLARRAVPAAMLLASILGACADDAGIGADAAAVLQPAVAGIDQAVRAGDGEGAQEGLDGLRAQVDDLVTRGTLDRDQGDEVLAAAEEVSADLDLLSTTTVPTSEPTTTEETTTTSTTRPETTTTSSTTTTTEPADEDDGNGNDGGGGKDGGGGGEDEPPGTSNGGG